jgi:hypothetical protein
MIKSKGERKVEIRIVFKNLALKPGLKGFLGGRRLIREDDIKFYLNKIRDR